MGIDYSCSKCSASGACPVHAGTVKSLAAALREYRQAVRNTVHAETHGTHGDGKLAARQNEERAALREVKNAIKEGRA